MQVLVAVASRHGGTREIGSVIADALRAGGHDVAEADPADVALIDPYAAVVLGSAVYNGRWLPEARELAQRAATSLSHRPVWLFSSGLATLPASAANSPIEMRDLTERIAARGHRKFAGRLDRSVLSFAERTIIAAARGRDGDYRDLDAVRAWAIEIATELDEAPPPPEAGAGARTRHDGDT
ncbi:protoporphyrinogen oxidase [mine drainage metagenome]|uniref:Protoporphyrinogen oxidase n=1 Tax=mine drainage metagenome TaxID=410659 RepID=A0A1J5QG11_9ZZZZ